MPIIRLLKQTSFNPDNIKIIVAAFDGARHALGLVDRDDPLNELVAKTIISAAEQGVDSADEIQQRALFRFRSSGQMQKSSSASA